MELCEILGISINEFLAGEDIDAENVEKKSEDNIIQVTKDSKKKQKNLKSILAVVTTFAVIMVLVLGTVFVHKVMQPKNYITAVDRTKCRNENLPRIIVREQMGHIFLIFMQKKSIRY